MSVSPPRPTFQLSAGSKAERCVILLRRVVSLIVIRNYNLLGVGQATKGGSPAHPSYPAGHAVQNGAYATVLKVREALPSTRGCMLVFIVVGAIFGGVLFWSTLNSAWPACSILPMMLFFYFCYFGAGPRGTSPSAVLDPNLYLSLLPPPA